MDLRYPCRRHTLSNGLVVILHEDRALPLVAVNLWYRVGSKDEPQGRTGFAHLFEHLMFMGTESVPGDGFDQLMEAHGGQNNASTSPDQTTYYSWGPKALLPTLLWLEADRMAGLGHAMTQEKLDLQREVVRNERRQSYENRPYGRTWLEMPGLLYPKGHPYHHPVIGSHEDLLAASVDDVRGFFDAWYVPSNASLVVAGDFDSDVLLPELAALFERIENRPHPPHRTAAPIARSSPIEHVIEDDVPAPRTLLTWASPARFADGDAACELMEDILGEGASSRLEQALVHQRRLAQDVGAWQVHGSLQSEFMVQATALPGVSLDEIESIITDELARLAEEGPTDEELAKVLGATEADFVRSSQELLERADDLNLYHTWLDDPDRIAWDLDRYRHATDDDVRSAARTWLSEPGHVRLRVEPRTTAVTTGGGVPATEGAVAATGTPPPEAAPVLPDVARPSPATTPWAPPRPDTTGTDDRVWHIASDRAPLIAFELLIPIGAEGDPGGREGRAALLCDLITEGAGGRTAEELAAAFDRLGTDLAVAPGRISIGLKINTLEKHLDRSLDLLADVLLTPHLDRKEFDRVHALALADLEQRRARPVQVAAVVAQRRLLADLDGQSHPIAGYADSVRRITLDDVKASHRDLVAGVPAARLIGAGAIDAGSLVQKLTNRLPLDLATGAASLDPLPAAATEGPLDVVLVDRPGSAQSVLRFMRRIPPLLDPVAVPLEIANTVFGGSFTSRLNQNLRERHGFTYGAGSSLRQGGRSGVFIASSSVQTTVTGRAIEELLNELAAITADPITDLELGKARATDHTDRVRAFENVSDIVESYASFSEAGAPPDAVPDYVRAAQAMTVGEVHEAATWIQRGAGVLAIVGDASRILPQLEGLPLPAPARVDDDGN
ncbi:MAG: peptidase M16 [Deltaproteobacteria bacterium]|nr:peptidase M16 [Deltaproteobacteria bacterium]